MTARTYISNGNLMPSVYGREPTVLDVVWRD